MKIEIEISSALRRFVNGSRGFSAEGNSLSEVFTYIEDNYPTFAQNIFTSERQLRSFISLFIDGKNYRVSENEDIDLTDKNIISFVPAIAGG